MTIPCDSGITDCRLVSHNDSTISESLVVGSYCGRACDHKETGKMVPPTEFEC